ncbi:MAG: AMP-binding protein [Deltaproteobacteria bacterium]|jgi:acyl-CoA synthetase (AMP-forming)/AMP-acid ligase II|nr:AMP-binding protein [Deltaproteobacteria bacterium]
MNHNIGQTLPAAAEKYPERTGLICKKGRRYHSWTFREMNSTADWFAYRLTNLGVKRGDRVMLMVKPSVEFITLTFALFKIGAVIILIDPGMGYKNLLRCIGQVKPAVFIGIARAHFFKLVFPGPFKSLNISVCIGPSFGLFGPALSAEQAERSSSYGTTFPTAEVQADDLAAILFTTGSTGPPKGVCYHHAIFTAQLELIRDYYRIGPDDIDQPAFPLFALFSTGLGACSVIPTMNPAKPAQLDPAEFIATINENRVTYTFGSPAIWNVVSSYCLDHKIKLNSVKKVLMAGAPVSGELLARTRSILSDAAEIHTPYGATESLPVASISAREILAETWEETRKGKGVCVGQPLPSMVIKIIRVSDLPIQMWDDSLVLPDYEIGEIAVKGPVVTLQYDNNDRENQLAKIAADNKLWHRMGDLGYLDAKGRLWFCGRKAHRVMTETGTMYTVCCEALFNEHREVFRSALVGVGLPGKQIPVLIVELHDKKRETGRLLEELRQIAQHNEMTGPIEHFLVHSDFPVDIRHNAKIFREKLAVWAEEKLSKQTSYNQDQG